MSVRKLGVFAAATVLLVAAKSGAVVDGVPVPNADRRFDAVGLFLTTSPGGGCAGWVSGTCTLIGPTTVLIARHSLDVQPNQPIPTIAAHPCRVRFRRAADGTSENNLSAGGTTCHGVYQEIDIVRLADAPNPNSDQVLATLARAPSGIRPVGMELNSPPTGATSVILAGWGYAGECFGAGEAWGLRMARGTTPTNAAGSTFLSYTTCSIGTSAPCLTCAPGPARVNANLHDSGAPIFVEVPSTDPTDPTPELRVIGSVSSLAYARRPSAWNTSGGTPALVQAVPTVHLKRSDFDGNGLVTTDDVFGFLGAFLGGHLDADIDQNGLLNVQDLFTFLDSWFTLR